MSITLRQFYDAGKTSLKLEIESGEAHLDHEIGEASINRPGLALAGFYQYFARRRIQVFGLAEFTYLRSLDTEQRKIRLE